MQEEKTEKNEQSQETQDTFTSANEGADSKCRYRGWCFTAFTPHFDSGGGNVVIASRWLDSRMGARYFICQYEIAPETGRGHYQGYVYLNNGQRFATVKGELVKIFGVQVHLANAKGTPQQNKAYCSKSKTAVPGTCYEWGELPTQGKRTDLGEIVDQITAGNSMRQIAEENPSNFIRYHRGIQALHSIMRTSPRDANVPTTVYWWFGPTGVGKSRLAFGMWPQAYVKMTSTHWWDGYEGQAVVLMDDYRTTMSTFSELLRILDRYPMRVQAKGTSFDLSAKTFVITTPHRPEVTWGDRTPEALDQLLRRITEIREFLPDGTQKILKDDSTCYVPEKQSTPSSAIATRFHPPESP